MWKNHAITEFYSLKLTMLRFKIEYPKSIFTLFVRADGSKNLRNSLKFYKLMGFDDVSAVSDLDYLFSNDIKYLLDSFGLDRTVTDRLRKGIGWTAKGDPQLDYVLSHYADAAGQDEFEKTLEGLGNSRFFILKHGAPETYYKNNKNDKDGWKYLNDENDLLEPDYLRGLMTELLK